MTETDTQINGTNHQLTESETEMTEIQPAEIVCSTLDSSPVVLLLTGSSFKRLIKSVDLLNDSSILNDTNLVNLHVVRWDTKLSFTKLWQSL